MAQDRVASTPPFDASSAPPFQCFFRGCTTKRKSYLGLMRHLSRDHAMTLADFEGTFFGGEAKKEKKAENKK